MGACAVGPDERGHCVTQTSVTVTRCPRKLKDERKEGKEFCCLFVCLTHGFRKYNPEFFGPITVGPWGGIRVGMMVRTQMLTSVNMDSKEKEEDGVSSILLKDKSAAT